MKNIFTTVGLIFITITCSSQVGIGTNSPQATIDIDGTVRVTSIERDNSEDNSITGVTGSNILNKTNLGANLLIENNELATSPVSRSMGTFNLGGVTTNGSGNIDALDLLMGPGEKNESATFIRVFGYDTVTNIAGIKGGYEGRRMTLYLSETSNVRFLENAASGVASDRIITLSNSQLTASGMAIIELVYDADAGHDSLGRWLVIKFRS